MKRFKEYMNEMTTQGWITFATIALLLIIIVTGGIFYYVKNPQAWPMALFGEKNESVKEKKIVVKSRDTQTDAQTLELINRAADAAFSTDTANTSAPVQTMTQGSAQSVSYQAQKEEVKIALIMAKNEYDVTNVISGTCGDVYMVTAFVPGPTVLTNSIKALFGNKIYGDFLPGNIIPTYHPDLFFKDVVITNGVAQIYLLGSFETGENTCKTELALAQLRETAQYYPNVTAAQIYLNGQRID